MAVARGRKGDGSAFSGPVLDATRRQLSDLYLLAESGFAPLSGFLNELDTRSVCTSMRLSTGEPWSIPIIFPIDSDTRARVGGAESILLLDGGREAGILHVEEVFSIDKDQYAKSVFRTADTAHPGVAWLESAGDYSVAGTFEPASRWTLETPAGLSSSPREVARQVAEAGWGKVVAFQTRNPIHRAHEFCTKIALETADGLVIHPLVGSTKADDIPVDVRMDCYRALIDNYYPASRTLLAGFPAWMRYAGPREAVFHAQVRKNYGVTHFIVGRDHAGVGDYYGPFDAQKIFSEFAPGELGIEPVFFDFVHFCRRCGAMASAKTCPHPSENHVQLRGRDLRAMLREGRRPPAEITRPEVAEVLIAAMGRAS